MLKGISSKSVISQFPLHCKTLQLFTVCVCVMSYCRIRLFRVHSKNGQNKPNLFLFKTAITFFVTNYINSAYLRTVNKPPPTSLFFPFSPSPCRRCLWWPPSHHQNRPEESFRPSIRKVKQSQQRMHNITTLHLHSQRRMNTV